MPQSRWPHVLWTPLVVAMAVGVVDEAKADDKQVCLESYDKSQTLRQEGKLVAAREQMLSCARNVCPEILRRDCTQWLSEVDETIPTVVLSVKDKRGQDLVDVRVTVDGEALVTQIDGKAVAVDPGVRLFRFDAPGEEPVEIVIHAASKNRGITIQFGSGSVDVEPQPDVTKPQQESGGPGVLPYVFGGIGLVGVGAFAFFGTQFDSKLDDLDKCKPNCSKADTDDASTTRTLAWISGGVGVVSLGVATYLFLSGSSDTPASVEVASALPRVELVPVRGGALGTFGTRF